MLCKFYLDRRYPKCLLKEGKNVINPINSMKTDVVLGIIRDLELSWNSLAFVMTLCDTLPRSEL